MTEHTRPELHASVPGSGVDLDLEVEVEIRTAGSRIWRRLRSDPGFWIGGAMVAALVVAAVLADLLAPYDPNLAIRGRGLTETGSPQPPSAEFLFGTDRLGRDYLSRVLHGARTSLAVGIGANVVATIIGGVVGAVAAFAGSVPVSLPIGRRRVRFQLPVETLLMRMTDVVLSLPALLLAIALVAVIGPSLLLILLVIAGLLWTTTARIMYSRVRQLTGLEFVDAARALGASPFRILGRHIAPHTISLLVVYATLGIAAAVLFEAGLSFLGVGVPPPAASWGTMISEHATYYRTEPRLLMVPGFAIMLTVLGFNLLGDALRDAIDPRGWE